MNTSLILVVSELWLSNTYQEAHLDIHIATVTSIYGPNVHRNHVMGQVAIIYEQTEIYMYVFPKYYMGECCNTTARFRLDCFSYFPKFQLRTTAAQTNRQQTNRQKPWSDDAKTLLEFNFPVLTHRLAYSASEPKKTTRQMLPCALFLC